MPDLTPSVRVEGILSGADITPATRLEYFLSKAANEIPKPAGVSDAGKVLTVKADGSGFELATPSGGAPLLLVVDGADVTIDVATGGHEILISGVAAGAGDFIAAVANDHVRGGIIYGPIEYDSNDSVYVMTDSQQYYSEIIGCDEGIYSVVSYTDSNGVYRNAVAAWDLTDPE